MELNYPEAKQISLADLTGLFGSWVVCAYKSKAEQTGHDIYMGKLTGMKATSKLSLYFDGVEVPIYSRGELIIADINSDEGSSILTRIRLT